MQGPWLAPAQPAMGSCPSGTLASMTLYLPMKALWSFGGDGGTCAAREASTHATGLAAPQLATSPRQPALTLQDGWDCQKGQDCWNKQTSHPTASTLPRVVRTHCTLLPLSSPQQPQAAGPGSAAVPRWLLHAGAQRVCRSPSAGPSVSTILGQQLPGCPTGPAGSTVWGCAHGDLAQTGMEHLPAG